MSEAGPAVGIIMGSQSDWQTMQHAAATLDRLGIGHEARIVSAHPHPTGSTTMLATPVPAASG